VAESGFEAITILKRAPRTDIVLMDIMMPVMDGYDTIRIIREHARFQELPIIAVTAKVVDAERQRCLDAGANDYLAKPLITEQLISVMGLWLALTSSN
jgi:hypothetical protein